MRDRALRLHPQVAIRAEPFGALAYHYGNRRLVFLKHRDLVDVIEQLNDHRTPADAFAACGIDERRWATFERALESLLRSEMLEDAATLADAPA